MFRRWSRSIRRFLLNPVQPQFPIARHLVLSPAAWQQNKVHRPVLHGADHQPGVDFNSAHPLHKRNWGELLMAPGSLWGCRSVDSVDSVDPEHTHTLLFEPRITTCMCRNSAEPKRRHRVTCARKLVRDSLRGSVRCGGWAAVRCDGL